MTALILWLAVTTPDAPAPLPRRPTAVKITPADMVGTWDVLWAGHKTVFTLYKDGNYTCQWFSTKYVGYWTVDRKGILYITETASPDDMDKWNGYMLVINPRTMTGVVSRTGKDAYSNTTPVSMKRR